MSAMDGSNWREHGTPIGRTVIASEAKQSRATRAEALDCFASLAMTEMTP
jgi:hypothetical protein